MKDVTERLGSAVDAYTITGNGRMAHVQMMKDAKAEIEMLRDVIRKNWMGDYWRGVTHEDADEVNALIGMKDTS